MTSVLRRLQAEWNELVPAAQARRVPRVRLLNAPLETIAYRRAKLEWLRAQLGVTTSLTAMSSEFDSLTFGVELEFLRPHSSVSTRELAERLTAAGVETRVEIYGHRMGSAWKIVSDASVHGSRAEGRELVSPPLRGEAGIAMVHRACEILLAAGCRINKSCGLHVHVGAANQELRFFKNLIKLYATAQGAIDSFLAPSRRGFSNGYCRPIPLGPDNEIRLDAASTVAEVALAIGQTGTSSDSARNYSRYRKLNLQSFWQHGTVEFRHHQGTVDPIKATHWVRLVLRMCLTAAREEKKVGSFDELMAAVGATGSEKNYFEGRIRYFGSSRRAA